MKFSVEEIMIEADTFIHPSKAKRMLEAFAELLEKLQIAWAHDRETCECMSGELREAFEAAGLKE
jgi:uncharacterized protein YyaL (SSP411 family)